MGKAAPFSVSEDYYTILGVPPTATVDEIKDRFRFFSHAYHPDKFRSESHRRMAEREFQRVNEAYQVLANPRRRELFDATRDAPDATAAVEKAREKERSGTSFRAGKSARAPGARPARTWSHAAHVPRGPAPVMPGLGVDGTTDDRAPAGSEALVRWTLCLLTGIGLILFIIFVSH